MKTKKGEAVMDTAVSLYNEMNFQESGLQLFPRMSLSCNSKESKELTTSAARI